MKERPILFSAPMVRAILDGTKTVTRRIVNLRQFGKTDTKGYDWTFRCKRGLWQDFTNSEFLASKYAECKTGERLWVRETWQQFDPHPDGDLAAVGAERLAQGRRAPHVGVTNDRPIEWTSAYRADGDVKHPAYGPANWRPSIHMPRWASRITLEVVSVRVERLHDITEDDARAEGVARAFDGDRDLGGWEVGDASGLTHRLAFEHLWNDINGDRAPWNTNPWVWRVEIKRLADEKAKAA